MQTSSKAIMLALVNANTDTLPLAIHLAAEFIERNLKADHIMKPILEPAAHSAEYARRLKMVEDKINSKGGENVRIYNQSL